MSLLIRYVTLFPTSSFHNFFLSSTLVPSSAAPHLVYLLKMATERLNSILSHLTPSKSGLSTMYAASPPRVRLRLLTTNCQQNPEERRRCCHYTCHTDASDQRLQRRHERYSARLHRVPAAQEGHREIKHRPANGRGCLPRECKYKPPPILPSSLTYQRYRTVKPHTSPVLHLLLPASPPPAPHPQSTDSVPLV